MEPSKEQLFRLYWNEELSRYDIAQELGIPEHRVRLLMIEYGIKTRSRTEAVRLANKKKGREIQAKRVAKLTKPMPPRNDLVKLYEKVALDDIAMKYDVCAGTVTRWFKRYNIPIRSRTERRRFSDSLHNNSLDMVADLFRKKGYRVIILGRQENTYIPDAILIKDDEISALEVQRRLDKRVKVKIEKAKTLGFDKVITYFLYRRRKSPIDTYVCRGDS